MLRLLSFLFLVSAFFSCLPEKTALERALREAGDNRMELEKVLAYYRDDTLKYQAACFLIENMPDQYAVLPLDSTDTYARALLSLDKEDPVSWEISRSLVAAVFDSISKIQPESRIKIVRDIEVMTSDYLIENIEWLSGNFWLVSFKISYLCLPLFYETRTTPSCHPSGCAYRQL